MSLLGRLFAPPQILFTEKGEPDASFGRAQRIMRWLCRQWPSARRAILRGSDAQREGTGLADKIVPQQHHDHQIHAVLATVLAHEIRRGIANDCNPFNNPGSMLKMQLSGGKDL